MFLCHSVAWSEGTSCSKLVEAKKVWVCSGLDGKLPINMTLAISYGAETHPLPLQRQIGDYCTYFSSGLMMHHLFI